MLSRLRCHLSAYSLTVPSISRLANGAMTKHMHLVTGKLEKKEDFSSFSNTYLFCESCTWERLDRLKPECMPD